MTISLAMSHGMLSLPMAMSPSVWHAHEMLYGYVSGVVAGFLLTAVPKWTGRAALAGPPLLGVFCLWVAARLASAVSAISGLLIGAALDVAFLLALCAVTLNDVIATRTWRDLRVLSTVGILVAGEIVFHVAAAARDTADLGIKIGVAGTITMIIVVGGRAVPGYTRTLLLQRDLLQGNAGPLPRPFSRVDAASIALGIVALAAWVLRPISDLTGTLLLMAGATHVMRGLRWAPHRVMDDRVILTPHLGYGFVAAGFMLAGLASLWPETVAADAGIHAWTTGAIGLMTLGVMSHLTLRHSEGRLVGSLAAETMCGAAILASVLRILAAILSSAVLMQISGALWIVAFGCFAHAHGPRLIRSRGSLKNVG